MKIRADARLAEEAERFAFRHTCDDCSHFDGARCGDDWPTAEHRLPIAVAREVVFCKEFEMGP